MPGETPPSPSITPGWSFFPHLSRGGGTSVIPPPPRLCGGADATDVGGSAQEDEATPEVGSARKCSAIPGKGQWALKRLKSRVSALGLSVRAETPMASLSGLAPSGKPSSPRPGPLAVFRQPQDHTEHAHCTKARIKQ